MRGSNYSAPFFVANRGVFKSCTKVQHFFMNVKKQRTENDILKWIKRQTGYSVFSYSVFSFYFSL